MAACEMGIQIGGMIGQCDCRREKDEGCVCVCVKGVLVMAVGQCDCRREKDEGCVCVCKGMGVWVIAVVQCDYKRVR